jgi:hypothetical protein
MKITKQQLKQIVKEEIEAVLSEQKKCFRVLWYQSADKNEKPSWHGDFETKKEAMDHLTSLNFNCTKKKSGCPDIHYVPGGGRIKQIC